MTVQLTAWNVVFMSLQRLGCGSFNLEIVGYSVLLCVIGHFEKWRKLWEINEVGGKTVGSKPTAFFRRFRPYGFGRGSPWGNPSGKWVGFRDGTPLWCRKVDMRVEELVRVGLALSAPRRLRVLQLIRENPMGVCRLAKAAGIAHSTVIGHVQRLEEAGLIMALFHGTKRVYQPTPLCDQLDFEDGVTPWHLKSLERTVEPYGADRED